MKVELGTSHVFKWNKKTNSLELSYDEHFESMEAYISKKDLKAVKKFFKKIKWAKHDKR